MSELGIHPKCWQTQMPETDIQNILYIEDDPAAAKLASVIFTSKGFHIEVAPTGKEGIELYETGRFDVILQDYNLPDINGIDVTIKILAKDPHAAIIFLTARGSEELAAKAIASGAAFYVAKDGPQVYSDILPELFVKAIEQKKERLVAAENLERHLVSEEKYRSIVENSAEGIISIDEHGCVESFNPHAEKIFGYQTSEIVGKNVSTLLPVSERVQHDLYLENSNIHASRIINQERELEGLRKDGSLFAIELNISPMIVGGAKKFIGIIRDITERKAVQEALRISEDRFRDFAESAADRFWETDEKFNYVYMSESSEKSSSAQLDDFEGQTPWELARNGSDIKDWKQLKLEVKARRPIRNFQYRWQAPGKAEVWFRMSARPYFDNTGEFKGYRGTNAEITESIEALRVQDRFFLAMERLDAGFVLWSVDKTLLACNDTFRLHQGNLAGELQPGVDYRTYITKVAKDQAAKGIDIGDAEKWIAQRVNDFDTDFVDREVQNAAGDWLRIRKRRLPDGSMLSFHEEINDIKENEQELQTAVELADFANQAKSEFLSSMSHELRTPLNAILGFGQLLETHPTESLSDKQSNYVKQILKGGAHLLDLIDQVLDLSKIESGNFSISIENVVFKTLIEECLSLVQTQADEKHIELELILPAQELPLIFADRSRFRQVLLNLLSNAIKYNRGGGKVTITAGKPDDRFQRISVSDTGLGIPKHKRDDIFKPFNRLGRETGEIEGTGIGLTITRKIIELMGGEIGFESEENVGSTFWVELPLSDEGAMSGEAIDTVVTDGLKKDVDAASGTILYIEDNPANLKLMQAVIEQLPNLTMMSAPNAEFGLSLARDVIPDLILMDINLPGMDGITALGILRETERTKSIPVIAVSAAAMQHEIEHGKAAGFNDYITKPIKVPEVLKSINDNIS